MVGLDGSTACKHWQADGGGSQLHIKWMARTRVLLVRRKGIRMLSEYCGKR